jgi:DNA-binding response OmpR family regulator
MIVDDDPNTAYILSMMLKLNDFEVLPYTNPEQAISSFHKDQVDLLLLDIEMPAISGSELYRKMRVIDENVKVCFMTNYPGERLHEFKKLFPDLARRNFSLKPASAPDLLEMVEGALGRR